MGSSSARSQLIVFCGKGGVGKTTLSLAYGLWHADHGRKAVVVTSHPLHELAVTISLQGLKEQHPKAASNLFVVHIDPREILGNKVRQQIPSEFLARKVLASRLYQNLVEVAPGLKEIAFLARLKQLAERKAQDGEGELYDLLIWDAPATGHFLQTLKVSQSFDTYISGPFAVLGKELLHFFSDAANLSLVPVTVLEEMAVDETLELCAELHSSLHMQPACLICNLASPLLESTDEEFQKTYDSLITGEPQAGGLKFVLDRQATERGLYHKLRSRIQTRFHVVRRVANWQSDLELLIPLGGVVEAGLADVGL